MSSIVTFLSGLTRRQGNLLGFLACLGLIMGGVLERHPGLRVVFPSNADCGVPTVASAISMNATAIPSGSLPFLTVYSSEPRPLASTLNAFEGQVTANSVIVPLLTFTGQFSVYASAATDLALDVNGYFAP